MLPMLEVAPSRVTYSGMLAPAPAAPPTREQIVRLQQAMLPEAVPMPEAVHHFAPVMYGREFSMPAGMYVIGKIHKHGHLMMVVKGRATVVDEFGRYEVAAGFVQSSRPGAKRAVLAHEDTTFVTVHLNATDTEDLDVIEAEHIAPEDAETLALIDKLRKEQLQ
jgi:quercetin dioxygenase-like cupin family protein